MHAFERWTIQHRPLARDDVPGSVERKAVDWIGDLLEYVHRAVRVRLCLPPRREAHRCPTTPKPSGRTR
jgi:hypothetical protein